MNQSFFRGLPGCSCIRASLLPSQFGVIPPSLSTCFQTSAVHQLDRSTWNVTVYPSFCTTKSKHWRGTRRILAFVPWCKRAAMMQRMKNPRKRLQLTKTRCCKLWEWRRRRHEQPQKRRRREEELRSALCSTTKTIQPKQSWTKSIAQLFSWSHHSIVRKGGSKTGSYHWEER